MSDIEHGKLTAAAVAEEKLALFDRLMQQKREREHQQDDALRIPRISRDAPDFPLSFAQQRVWFLEQYEPDTALYNIPGAYTITGLLDRTALFNAMQSIVARHETLRTTFIALEGSPRQVIAAPQPITIPYIDLRDIPAPERAVAATTIRQAEALRPFNLAKGPLLRVLLVQLAPDEHILIITFHHIIFDGWSNGVLLREMQSLYQAFARQEIDAASALPDLAMQYVDFAVWQRAWLQGARLTQQLAYWKARLTDVPALQIPTDFPRPAIQTIHGEATGRLLSPRLSEQLIQLGRQENCSLFMVMLGAFAIALGRYANQDDFAIGTIIANRNQADIEPLIGFFVNTLILRMDLAGNPTFRELLRQVRATCLGSYAHQDLPFEQLVDELQPKRDLSRSPLAQVTMTVQNKGATTNDTTGLVLTPIMTDVRTSKYDLMLDVIETDQGLFLDTEYKLDLFSQATIDRLLEHLEVLLTAAVAQPDSPIQSLAILTSRERQQLLTEWNTGRAHVPHTQCLHEIFAEHAAARPDAIALSCEDTQLTYREVNERANQLARHLRTHGVGLDVYVGLCVEHSLELLIGILGILKAGGAYVPLDPNYPRERLAFIIDAIKPPVILTLATNRAQLPTPLQAPHGGSAGEQLPTLICLDDDWAQIAKESVANVPTQGSPDNLAYVIFTSGSTGIPKGVLITHANVTRLLAATDHWFNFNPSDAGTLFHSFAFDVSVWEIWLTLLYGARLVIVPRAVVRSPETFYDLLVSEQVTVLDQTPSAFRQLIQVEDTLGVSKPLALRYVIFAGEALPMASLRPWFKRHSDQAPRLINMYGITETTVHSTYRVVTQADTQGLAASMIGCAIPDLSLYVLDRNRQPVPIGVPGELYVGGAGLARGYLNRPDLTAERFIPNPFSDTPDDRLYKSGDLVRYHANGDMEYLGRIDHQVKVRGYRIELGEIEAVLHQHPAVREALVVVQEDAASADDSGGERKRLLAYVTRKQHQLGGDNQQGDGWTAEKLAHWRQMFDTIYKDAPVGKDPTFNTAGWKSSYTNQPISADEMHERVNHVVATIRARQPQSILEIGCGMGLLLFPLAPACQRYVATDFSEVATDHLRAQIAQQDLKQVTVLERAADDFTAPLAEQRGTFDVVLINGVTQYLPSVDYLVRVLEGAVQMVAPGGIIFIGGVRNRALLEAFHTSVQLRQAPLSLLNEQLRLRIQKHSAQEDELALDPAFFTALQRHLPHITHVGVELLHGRTQNELTRFQYDVTLAVACPVRQVVTVPERTWQSAQLTLAGVRDYLSATQPDSLRITGIPNARLITDTNTVALLTRDALHSSVGELWQALGENSKEEPGIEPEDLWQLGADMPYAVTLTWSATGPVGALDMLLVRHAPDGSQAAQLVAAADAPAVAVQPWGMYANTLAQGESSTNNLAPELRDYLKRRIPEYMIPAIFMVLDAFPLTNNGKIDRKALPLPDGLRPELKSAFVAPRTLPEQQLAAIWSEVLGLEKVGVHDNFFELGGDSLLSIRVVAKAGQAGLSITTKQFFQHQTIAELATITGTTQTLADQGISTGSIHQMPSNRFMIGPGTGHEESHSLVYLLDGPTPLDPTLLEDVAVKLLNYHDGLRLRAVKHADHWELSIGGMEMHPSTWQVDVSMLPEVERITVIRQLARDLALHYDMAGEPKLRLALCTSGPNQSTPLLVSGHGLAIDMQSWQFLLEDLNTAYAAMATDAAFQFPPKTTASKQWVDRLVEYARSPELLAKLPYWLSEERQQVRPLPKDFPDGVPFGSTLAMEIATLTVEETAALQRKIIKIEGLEIDAVVYTAAAFALRQLTGQDSILVTFEGNGRSTEFDDIDLSHTLGTFAIEYPVLLNLANVTDIPDAIQKMRGELRALPQKGMEYSTLRFLSDDPAVTDALAAMPHAEAMLNYLAGLMAPEVTGYTVSGPFNGQMATIDDSFVMPTPLVCTGYIADGILQATWHYSTNHYRSATIQQLANQMMDQLRKIMAAL